MVLFVGFPCEEVVLSLNNPETPLLGSGNAKGNKETYTRIVS